MPQKLSIFLIALVGLLTSFIPVSITTQDAYALKIGAQETFDFYLDFPLGKNTKNEDIKNYIEVKDWLLTDHDEIGVKEVPLPSNSSTFEINSPNSYQTVVKKLSSNMLIIPSILIFISFLTCAALVFHDKLTFQTVLHNCFRSEKSISCRRITKEIVRFSQFVLTILLIIVFYTVFSTTLIFALCPQDFLWNDPLSLIVLLLYFGVTFYFSVFIISRTIFKGYKNRAIRRGDYYSFNNLSILNKKTSDTG